MFVVGVVGVRDCESMEIDRENGTPFIYLFRVSTSCLGSWSVKRLTVRLVNARLEDVIEFVNLL